VSSEGERAPYEIQELPVVDDFRLVGSVGIVMKPICIRKHIVKSLRAAGIENLISRSDALLAKVDELTEHVSRCKPVRVGNSNKSLQHRAKRFRNLPIIGDAAVQIFPQHRMPLVVLGNQVMMNDPGAKCRAVTAPADFYRFTSDRFIGAFPQLAQEGFECDRTISCPARCANRPIS